MLKIDNIKLPITAKIEELDSVVMSKLGCGKIKNLTILKKSIDARDKGKINYIYSVAVELDNEDFYLNSAITKYNSPIKTIAEITSGMVWKSKYQPVVVGMGPAGMFIALTLATMGAKPIVFERGSMASERKEAIDKFFLTNILDTETNVQFGEGGAGTFSDGKLNTNLRNEFIAIVLNEFVRCGAPEEIMYESKPHIGTDKLLEVVQNMRKKLVELGGEVHFNSKITNIMTDGNKLKGVEVNGATVPCDRAFFAIGHSARDTYKMLYDNGLKMEQKAFSLGVRIEHKQEEINKSQYGRSYNLLPPADYKMAVHLKDRSLYTFCMCPGGKVINASSEAEHLCVNGMSEYKRDFTNANSAILVGVTPADFDTEHPLSGIDFQRKYENLAYKASNSYKAPVQTLGDLFKGKESKSIGEVKPSIESGYTLCDLRSCLPDFVVKGIIQGVPIMARKLYGFDRYDSILTGVEARSSSPVRILRDDNYQTNIEGLYPVGEGAGYAGGITSSAIDGIKCVMHII
jgi:uncharacterized FAD-dependent dehydrogenase